MLTSLKEKIIQAIDELTEEQQQKLWKMIKKVREESALEASFLASIKSEADPRITLEQVRQGLSSIKGNLSDLIIQEREAR
ncbi:hypothetical protein KAX17_01220 [Candidatus Bipolaricaulota bacterium]|nr:hypothetical protein [Candidatus Bipolaricaulota bacterium]